MSSSAVFLRPFFWPSRKSGRAKKFGPIFEKFYKIEVKELIKDKKAITIGQRIFANTCFGCHGSDARGAPGYPNLTDSDWLYGSTPDDIKATITNGRTGVMPALGGMLNDDDLTNVTAYVMSLSGRDAAPEQVAAGKEKFVFCAACHGADAKGNPLMGAADLTDSVWLYGGSAGMIKKSIKDGRNGVMPAHLDILTAEQIHLVTAYIYSFGNH